MNFLDNIFFLVKKISELIFPRAPKNKWAEIGCQSLQPQKFNSNHKSLTTRHALKYFISFHFISYCCDKITSNQTEEGGKEQKESHQSSFFELSVSDVGGAARVGCDGRLGTLGLLGMVRGLGFGVGSGGVGRRQMKRNTMTNIAGINARKMSMVKYSPAWISFPACL